LRRIFPGVHERGTEEKWWENTAGRLHIRRGGRAAADRVPLYLSLDFNCTHRYNVRLTINAQFQIAFRFVNVAEIGECLCSFRLFCFHVRQHISRCIEMLELSSSHGAKIGSKFRLEIVK